MAASVARRTFELTVLFFLQLAHLDLYVVGMVGYISNYRPQS
jgi:hypothetical protein